MLSSRRGLSHSGAVGEPDRNVRVAIEGVGMRLRVRWFVTGFLLLVSGIAAAYVARGPSGPARPSVVLLIIDTLRADKLGVYGSQAPASAELDELARGGVVFEQAVAQASWTRSSVASLLTGTYPRRAGVVKERWDPLPPEATTLAERLAPHGYETVGLTANPHLNRDFNFDQGFSRYVESTVLFPWMPKQAGKAKATKEAPIRPADELLAEACRLVEARDPSAPLFLQLLLMDVHAHHRIAADDVDPDLRSHPDPAYLQAVRNATRPVARFVRDLDRLLGGDVVFVVTADHGEGLGDHADVGSSKGHGNLLYRSQLHVPLVFIGGSARPLGATRVPGVTELVDLVPTTLELAGLDVPPGLDGVSQASVLAGGPPANGRLAVSETQWRPGVAKIAATDGEWLYVESADQWPGSDPAELQPFWGPQNGSATNELRQRGEIATPLRGALEKLS